MVSHSRRFIFLHIPKTGGTSVSKALSRYGVALQGPKNCDSVYFKHAYARDLKRMLGDEYDRYFKFTIVRNPWDWVASNYAFNRGLHLPWTRGTPYAVSQGIPDWAAGWSFKTWLRWWLDTFSPSQSRMLTDAGGTLLVDRVLRFEHLHQDFEELCSDRDLRPAALAHEKRNEKREGFESYYDAESWEWVAVHFAEDLGRFRYDEAWTRVVTSSRP
jgi:hypothetical protein